MAINIDELQIQIGIEASKSASGLKQLASGLRSAAAGAKSTAKALEETANAARDTGTSTSKCADEVAQAGDEACSALSRVGESAKKASPHIKDVANKASDAQEKATGLLNAFKRIATYRLIRSAIRMITQAISDGIKGLIEWDRQQGNNTSNAAKTADEIKAKWGEVKASVGAAAMPLIQIFQPALMLIMNGLIKVFELIQMILRSLQGYKTYMKAVYKETQSTAGAAKALQRILFGFDELNVLPSQTGAGGGTSDGGWGYEEVPINSKLLNGIADITNLVRKLLEPVGVLSTALDTILATLLAIGGAKVLRGIRNLLGGFSGLKTYIAMSLIPAISDAWALLKEQIAVNVVFPARQAIISAAANVYGWAKGVLTATAITIKTAVASALAKAQEVFYAAKAWVEAQIITIKTAVASALAKAQEVFYAAKAWVEAQIITIKTAVASALAKAQEVFYAAKAWVEAQIITIKTAVADASALASAVWAKAKDILSVPITIPVVIGAAGLAYGLISAIRSLQTAANENPVQIPTQVLTGGLALELGKHLSSLQSQLNGNPLSISTKLNTDKEQIPSPFSIESRIAALDLPSVASAKGTSGSKIPLATDPMIQSALGGGGAPTGKAAKALGLGATALAAAGATALIAGSGGLAAIPLLAPLLGYAGGGIPDIGTLFYAGEAGAEIVATGRSGQTGVMNMQQMQEAVASGNMEVVNALYAVANMLGNEIRSKDNNVYLDGDKIGQSVSRYQYNQARRGIQGAY